MLEPFAPAWRWVVLSGLLALGSPSPAASAEDALGKDISVEGPATESREVTESREKPLPDFGPTPMLSVEELQAGEFHIPAPRGMILAAGGEPLAQSRVAGRIVLPLGELDFDADRVLAFLEDLRRTRRGLPWLSIREKELERHLAHRRWVPLPISKVLDIEQEAAVAGTLPEECEWETVYQRFYPEGKLFAHTIGYAGERLPDQHGPIGEVEYLWPPGKGRAGMEKTLDDLLTGVSGRVSRLHDETGKVIHEMIGARPVPGKTVVLSLHLRMQKLAMERLAASGRPGAFVAVDADTGDVLAMASYPSFDSNLFIGGISQPLYDRIAKAEEAPLFDRAVIGEYPPGSTFKPFVALAGMASGTIEGLHTLYPGPAVLVIAGRPFKNWSQTPEGNMDLCYALMRSCNTWFYQAGMNMGAEPITDVSHRFGLGIPPRLPLPAVATGNIPDPEVYNDPKSLANYSIGQGRVLVSPVQMAFAMAALANGTHVPEPRLIREIRDPISGEILERRSPEIASRLNLDPNSIDLVRDGMWAVVNHGSGTAGRAYLRSPVVYGKTGTAEWAEEGEKRSLAWFTGWVDSREPRIAFAAVTHGRRGDVLSGGRSAAPIAASVLKKVYSEPDLYAVNLPETSRPAPSIRPAEPVVLEEEIEIRPRNPIARFFRGLFGRKPPPPSTPSENQP